jgi:hypothetical protein
MNQKIHENLKGFVEHGVTFTRHAASQSQGICPFCNKDKFFVSPETMLWDCKICIIDGNFDKFLEHRMKQYRDALKGAPLLALAKNRGLKPQTLAAWGVGFDPVTGLYMVPMNGNEKRSTRDIHRYTLGKKAHSTSKAHLQLFMPLQTYGSHVVWIAEGEWDAMALWEALKALGIKEDVYASPGAGTFPKDLAPLLTGKEVRVPFDNDSPGKKGAARTGNLLDGLAKAVKYLHWPSNLNLADGFDVRDLYTKLKAKDAKATLDFLTQNLKGTPPADSSEPKGKSTSEDEINGQGLSREETLERYRQWLHLKNPELLDVLFGSVFANRMNIDPLWMFFVAPPGGSKTELLMSLSDAPFMKSTTTLTPQALVSGDRSGPKGDPSLIPQLKGQVLVIKDFTTILNLNQTSRDEIFGILRDAYDGRIEKYFGNGVHRQYPKPPDTEPNRFGILAGVTPAIEGLSNSNSVLGERFIKYKIKQPGTINKGKEVIRRALENMAAETEMRGKLCAIAKEVLNRRVDRSDYPVPDEAAIDQLMKLGQWVAALRGVVSRDRYSGSVNFKPVSEIGTRLSKQFCALAMGIGIYRREKTITNESLDVVRSVAKDTAPDRVEEIVKQLYLMPADSEEYVMPGAISEWTRLPSGTVSLLLQDLNMLHIVQKESGKLGAWRLSASVRALIDGAHIYDRERKTRRV